MSKFYAGIPIIIGIGLIVAIIFTIIKIINLTKEGKDMNKNKKQIINLEIIGLIVAILLMLIGIAVAGHASFKLITTGTLETKI